MEKNKELIVKYLSDLMTNEEKIDFENKLVNDSEFRKKFEFLKSSINIDKELIDEKYFINLLPKVRKRINYSPKYPKKKYLFAFSSLAVSFILIFVLITNIKEHSTSKDENISVDAQELAQYFLEVDDETKAKYFDILTSQPISFEITNFKENDEILKLYDLFPDELSMYNTITEEEVNKIISELK